MERGQFTFYRSFWEAIKELPSKDKAAVICAVCAYALDGEEPNLTGTQKAIFVLIRPTLDASAKKAENGKLGGKNKEANEKQTASKPQANEKQTASEKENEGEKEGEKENECSPPISPPRPARAKYGKYGWVLLSLDEYRRLSEDLGPEELQRCIKYIDEAAQSSGNKNRWKDWNLVIRRCSRENWGWRSERGLSEPAAAGNSGGDRDAAWGIRATVGPDRV